MMSKRLLWWLKLLVSAGLIAWLVSHIGIDELIALGPDTRPGWLLLGIPVIALGFIANGLSLWVLYRNDSKHPLAPKTFFAAFFQMSFIALWLPGRIGDLSIAVLLKGQVSAAHSMVYVLVDKVITLFVLGAVAAIGCFFLFSVQTGVLCVAALALSWLLMIVVLRQKRLYRLVIKKLPPRISKPVRKLRHAWRDLSRHRRSDLITNFVITFVRLLVIAVTIVYLLRTFGGDSNYLIALYVLAIVQLLSLVPISIQGIGIVEGAYILLLSPQGMASEASILAACMAGRIITIIVVALMHMSTLAVESAEKNQ